AAAGRPFDAVLIDPRIPGIDAYLGARSSLTRTPGASPPLIAMLYTNLLTADVAHLHSSGINHYVVKPVKASELISTLASVFNRTISPKSAPERTGAPHPEPEQRALRILLADDSRDNQQLVLAFLRKMPYQIDLADDGGKAIEKFSQGRYDLVLMDIQMPGIDGYAATRTIRQWEDQHGGEHCPIIALTASAFEDAILEARAAGCDAHLAKPVSKAALLRAIRDAVEAHKVTSFPLSTPALTQ
ncbi:MAG TPA: response regulator, partial [Candidatus Binataceae bacterium]|nr:response regulator [Candidatus Binataceae bacterium]